LQVASKLLQEETIDFFCENLPVASSQLTPLPFPKNEIININGSIP
jgi:hypothetical protein